MESTYRNSQVIVTGGASFIGSHLVDRLVDLNANVTVIDNLSSGKLENLRPPPGIEFIHLDLRNNLFDVIKVFQSKKPRIVFHLAAVHGGRGFIEKFPQQMLSNLALDNNVLTASFSSEVDMVIHASSACSYPTNLQSSSLTLNLLNEGQAGFDKAGHAYPDGVYGWVKLIGELQLATLASKSDYTRGRSARIFTAYGPRENESHAAIALIAKSLLQVDPFPIWGDGNQTRNFTFVDDTVKGLLLLGADRRQDPYDVVNIGSSMHVRVLDFIHEIHDVIGWSPKEFDFQTDKPVGVASRASDNDKITKLFNWEPSTAIRSGIERTLAWYSKKLDRPQTVAELEDLLLARG